MKTFKGIFIFILGMLVGIILFVVAIGGAAYAIATSTTIGQLQNTVGVDIVDKDSGIIDKSILEVVKSIITDVQNIDKLTLRTLVDKYGLPIPTDISGIDLTVVFDYPVHTIGNHVTEIVNSVTLEEIGSLVGVDFSSYDIPVLIDNLDKNIQTALNNVLGSIDSDTMTLRSIEDKFGITLGENEMFSAIKDAPFSAFGDILGAITIGELIDVERDLFAVQGENEVFVKADAYEPVSRGEYDALKAGADKYVSGVENGKLVWKELRYVKKTVVNAEGVQTEKYVVDNASNAAGFDPSQNQTVYYRHIAYKAYDSEADYPSDTEFFVPAAINSFEADGNGFKIKTEGYISLKSLFRDAAMTDSLNEAVSQRYLNIKGQIYYASPDDGAAVAAKSYGVPSDELISASTKLTEGGEGYCLIYSGASEPLLQLFADYSMNRIQDISGAITNFKVGDVLSIDENSSQLLQSVKDKTFGELTTSMDGFTLGSIMDITQSAYVPDGNGEYVFIECGGNYIPYDGAVHAGMSRYAFNYEPDDNGKYVSYGGEYYLYKADDGRFEGLQRYDRVYFLSAAGDYVLIPGGGYFTLYNPALHNGYDRFTLFAREGYAIAGDAQIQSGQNLYYYDTSAGTMQPYTGGSYDRLYVQGVPSEKILQRLAFTSISDFNDAIGALILGDVLDVKVDVYAVFSEGYSTDFVSGTEYFWFDDGLYKPAAVFDTAFREAHTDETIYVRSASGGGNAVLKKLALIKVNEFAQKMDEVMDTLYLSDVIEITSDIYIPDDNGRYVYMRDGDYYTLFNAADEAHGLLGRFTKYAGFSVASKEQIEANSDIYYYDKTKKAMLPYTDGEHGTLYYKGATSSKVLQRFAKTSLGNFASSFDGLILGDVLDIEQDIYTPVTSDFIEEHPGETYYYYNDGVYAVADAAYRGNHPSARFFTLEERGKGTSNVILKRLALVPVNDMSSKMTEVINDTVLTELFEIVSAYGVRDFQEGDDSAQARWIIPHDKHYTETTADGEYAYYAFAYSSTGKYYRTQTLYLPADTQQLTADGSGYYGYTQYNSLSPQEQVQYAFNKNIYYLSSDDGYVYNPAVAAYIIASGDTTSLYCRTASASGISFAKYKAQNLYVKILGEFTAYNPENPAHSDMDKFYKYADGYYPASDEVLKEGKETLYYYDYSESSYVTDKNENCCETAYVKLAADSAGCYYFSKLDSSYANQPVYSKMRAEYIKKADGEYVNLNGIYDVYDSADAEHEGLARYTLGYLASLNENFTDEGTKNELSSVKVTITEQKSAPILMAFERNKVTVATMSGAIMSLTLSDLMEIEPGSPFDDDALKNATLSDIGRVLTDKLNNMSIGDLLDWGNITTINANVEAVLEGVTLKDFFGSLEFDSSTGTVTINLNKLYHIGA